MNSNDNIFKRSTLGIGLLLIILFCFSAWIIGESMKGWIYTYGEVIKHDCHEDICDVLVRYTTKDNREYISKLPIFIKKTTAEKTKVHRVGDIIWIVYQETDPLNIWEHYYDPYYEQTTCYCMAFIVVLVFYCTWLWSVDYRVHIDHDAIIASRKDAALKILA